jgi:hypothetical protein
MKQPKGPLAKGLLGIQRIASLCTGYLPVRDALVTVRRNQLQQDEVTYQVSSHLFNLGLAASHGQSFEQASRLCSVSPGPLRMIE